MYDLGERNRQVVSQGADLATLVAQVIHETLVLAIFYRLVSLCLRGRDGRAARGRRTAGENLLELKDGGIEGAAAVALEDVGD